MEPVELQTWANENKPSDEMLWKNGYWNQIVFVRDKIAPLLVTSYEEYKALKVHVISTHMSKSIRLPVFRIKAPNGIVITMRYNFHNWKVSIESPQPIYIDFMNLFNPKEINSILPIYCEGFPKEAVFGCYAENKQRFTVELGTEYHLYTFFWILSHQTGLT